MMDCGSDDPSGGNREEAGRKRQAERGWANGGQDIKDRRGALCCALPGRDAIQVTKILAWWGVWIGAVGLGEVNRCVLLSH